MIDPNSTNVLNLDALMPVIGKVTANIVRMAGVFAGQGETLLISGPTGSGKSRLARWCHEQSPRCGQQFETLDLLSVPENLQMAELVGWKRGAFTGASHNVPGALTRAAKGTLFIDEIDKLSLAAQSGLLRILEERRYRPLGDGTDEQRADVHFIVGTNADLHKAVRAGQFREDLYYRINVLPVRLPPLAERIDEVPAWATFMLERCSGDQPAELVPEAIEALCRHPWPGNLRQLDNVVRRAYALALADSGEQWIVEARHVARALAFEESEQTVGITARLWRVAQELAREAVERERVGAEPLALELMDGFRGMVLGAAVEQLGSREDAFALFDREHLLVGRNHHRALKRELRKVRALVQALDEGRVDPKLRALMDIARPSRAPRDESEQSSSL